MDKDICTIYIWIFTFSYRVCGFKNFKRIKFWGKINKNNKYISMMISRGIGILKVRIRDKLLIGVI